MHTHKEITQTGTATLPYSLEDEPRATDLGEAGLAREPHCLPQSCPVWGGDKGTCSSNGLWSHDCFQGHQALCRQDQATVCIK